MKHNTITARAAIRGMSAICATTFSIAILALTATPADAAECESLEGSMPLLCGTVTAGNEPVGGVTVEVRDPVGNVVATAETTACVDAQPCGAYTHFNLPPGTYTLCAVAPDGECGDTASITVTEDSDFNTWVSTSGSDPVRSLRVDLELPADPPVQSGPGTGTPGYWKNHASAWPAAGVTVGGVLYANGGSGATIADAIKLMGKVGGDKTVTIFSSLTSAKLNVAIGNNATCISATIAAADAWLATHPVGTKVSGSNPDWSGFEKGEFLHQQLDSYNNGLLCAPHRN
jgi:hypothetical protein